jgi:hypothetical protein
VTIPPAAFIGVHFEMADRVDPRFQAPASDTPLSPGSK